jgi:hypothetical protein
VAEVSRHRLLSAGVDAEPPHQQCVPLAVERKRREQEPDGNDQNDDSGSCAHGQQDMSTRLNAA